MAGEGRLGQALSPPWWMVLAKGTEAVIGARNKLCCVQSGSR